MASPISLSDEIADYFNHDRWRLTFTRWAAAARDLELENLAQAATIKKAELLAAHLQELNSAIMENVNRAMEIVNGR